MWSGRFPSLSIVLLRYEVCYVCVSVRLSVWGSAVHIFLFKYVFLCFPNNLIA